MKTAYLDGYMQFGGEPQWTAPPFFRFDKEAWGWDDIKAWASQNYGQGVTNLQPLDVWEMAKSNPKAGRYLYGHPQYMDMMIAKINQSFLTQSLMDPRSRQLLTGAAAVLAGGSLGGFLGGSSGMLAGTLIGGAAALFMKIYGIRPDGVFDWMHKQFVNGQLPTWMDQAAKEAAAQGIEIPDSVQKFVNMPYANWDERQVAFIRGVIKEQMTNKTVPEADKRLLVDYDKKLETQQVKVKAAVPEQPGTTKTAEPGQQTPEQQKRWDTTVNNLASKRSAIAKMTMNPAVPQDLRQKLMKEDQRLAVAQRDSMQAKTTGKLPSTVGLIAGSTGQGALEGLGVGMVADIGKNVGTRYSAGMRKLMTEPAKIFRPGTKIQVGTKWMGAPLTGISTAAGAVAGLGDEALQQYRIRQHIADAQPAIPGSQKEESDMKLPMWSDVLQKRAAEPGQLGKPVAPQPQSMMGRAKGWLRNTYGPGNYGRNLKAGADTVKNLWEALQKQKAYAEGDKALTMKRWGHSSGMLGGGPLLSPVPREKRSSSSGFPTWYSILQKSAYAGPMPIKQPSMTQPVPQNTMDQQTSEQAATAMRPTVTTTAGPPQSVDPNAIRLEQERGRLLDKKRQLVETTAKAKAATTKVQQDAKDAETKRQQIVAQSPEVAPTMNTPVTTATPASSGGVVA